MEKQEIKGSIIVDEKVEKINKTGKPYFKIKSGSSSFNILPDVGELTVGKTYTILYTEDTYNYNGKPITSRWITKFKEGMNNTEMDVPINTIKEKIDEPTLEQALMMLTATMICNNPEIKSERLKVVYDELKRMK